jgi:hypothetical protein
LGNEASAEAGAGVFWAVAMMVDTSRNVRSRRMGVRVLGERITVSNMVPATSATLVAPPPPAVKDSVLPNTKY